MDGFLLESNSDLPFGYYDSTEIPYYWDYASQFVLLDNYYTSVMGSSIPNHLYLLTGQSGTLHDNPPWRVDIRENITSITDELDKNNVTWKYYYGFTQPFQWIKSFEVKSRLANIIPEDKFISDVANNSLPSVAWITPTQSEHPPLDVTKDQRQVVSLVNAIMQSNYWNSTVIFITWDDWGGWYDHVSPPQVDKFGYGFRAPLLVISPYAKQGFVDHTLNDHTSILKFIENLYSLPPLAKRDAAANNLLEPFNFSQIPRTPLILPGQYVPDHYPLQIESNHTIPEFGQLVPLSFVIALFSILLISRARF